MSGREARNARSRGQKSPVERPEKPVDRPEKPGRQARDVCSPDRTFVDCVNSQRCRCLVRATSTLRGNFCPLE